MPRKAKKKQPVTEKDVEGLKLLQPLKKLLAGLRDESNPNRELHFDDYVVLLILYFFSPTLTSLRGLQAASEFPKVRKKLGIPRSSLGSLSAAQHVFDPELVAEWMPDLVKQTPANKGDPRLRDLKKVLTVADGTLLKALPSMTWAFWLNNGKRAAKAHVQFEVARGVPSRADLTAANASERDVFESRLEANRFYVLDSGYAKFALFQSIMDVGSNFACRLPSGWKYDVLEERPLTEADREARVLRDVVVKLGSTRESSKLRKPIRLVEIERVDEPSKRMRSERPVRETILIATDRFDLSAELVGLVYSARWEIEIFFRWLKCTLGCNHLLAKSESGVALQLYSALIACLLISLWVKKKPTKRTYEAICFYFQGLADVEDVLRQVERLKAHDAAA